jgi:Flp pilus assembly protein TadD/peroxiredoxin
VLNDWSSALKAGSTWTAVAAKLLHPSIQGVRLTSAQESKVRSGYGLEVVRRRFAGEAVAGRERFLAELRNYFSEWVGVDTAQFEVVGIQQVATSPLRVRATIRHELVGGAGATKGREQRIGLWRTEWKQDESGSWSVVRWEASEETVSRVFEPIFLDVTAQALGQTESYTNQLLRGVDHWRTVLDGACGIDVYGNNGVAAGDFDGDGFDDLYICQPAGLPNRLYHNRGDGTFEDVTQSAGVGVLDATACALFADFENKGSQDLLVVCGSGPLLFVNQGGGKFSLKRDAFHFARPPQGTFTHAAVADYDRDGRVDIYFCVYSYYLGLDQYHYPAPYFDARNGPPNFLMRNAGDGRFEDRTEESGLHVDNDRYSFACAWGNYGESGAPDLYVANDFGRNNLYRNNGDGTFQSVATQAGVEDPGAGMSACWLDVDNDGRQDIYVSNMWSAAGIRVSNEERFHGKEPEEIRALYRRHAGGNSLYRNLGNGKFKNTGSGAGVDMGRWAWSSDAWDFDHDGYTDVYVANGYISGENGDTREETDASSFFWRQVVAKSPSDRAASPGYERGWNAINELIRSDATWSGHERNVFYANNRDGTFSDVSGVVGLDFVDDSRAFALADLDHDGRLEVVLKNRTGPQLRVLRNSMTAIGNAIAFRLRGSDSNRDAIGAAVTVESAGLRQTKYVQAGTGFLSQHSKELFFGLGKSEGNVRASIRWPSGATQSFEKLSAGYRIAIEEGRQDYDAAPFRPSSSAYTFARQPQRSQATSSPVETWLIEPLSAPEFSLLDLSDKNHDLRSLGGESVLLNFWVASSPESIEQLRRFQQARALVGSSGVRLVAIHVDSREDRASLRTLAKNEGFAFPILLGTPELAGVYNVLYRYLFDRRRNLGFPMTFLVDGDRKIAKVYQGQVSPERLIGDVKSIPRSVPQRIRKALPFEGTLCTDVFRRNEFTYGVAFYQRGYFEQAAASFRQVIQTKPDEPEAYYNLGTLYLRQNALGDARQYLERAVKLRPDYAEAWNNLGMTAAQQGQPEEAIREFRKSLELKPDYVIALVNLGNFYRRQEAYGEADRLLNRALELEPGDPEVNYSVGMLYARENQLPQATQQIERALDLRPEYPDALNNLGVLLVRQQRYSEAKERFETCIRVAPSFDQAYLNLAKLYVLLNDRGKAREILQTLLEKQPEHKLARQTLEMLD